MKVVQDEVAFAMPLESKLKVPLKSRSSKVARCERIVPKSPLRVQRKISVTTIVV